MLLVVELQKEIAELKAKLELASSSNDNKQVSGVYGGERVYGCVNCGVCGVDCSRE